MGRFSKQESVGIVILAGGRSSRMGTNKALLPIDGKPNIQHIRDVLRGVHVRHQPGMPPNGAEQDFLPCLIVTNEPDTYQFLGERMVSDKYPGLGPLAGIQVGLQAAVAEWNLVVACDMPLVTAEAGQWMLQVAIGTEHPDIDAVVPVIEGQLHPLFAVYHKRCAERIEDMLLNKQLRMVELLRQLQVKQLTEADFPNYIDVNQVFFNMNTPDEWRQVQQWIMDEGRNGN